MMKITRSDAMRNTARLIQRVAAAPFLFAQASDTFLTYIPNICRPDASETQRPLISATAAIS